MDDPGTLEALRLVANLIIATLNALWWAYTFMKYGELPDKVPLHFGITGKPDRWSSRPMVFLLPAVGTGISIFMFLASETEWQFHWMRLMMAAVFAFLQWTIIRVAMKGSDRLNILLLVALIAVMTAPLLILTASRG